MKRITKQERMRRVLVGIYSDMCQKACSRNGYLLKNLDTMDAIKDLVTDNSLNMSEWQVSEDGKISFT